MIGNRQEFQKGNKGTLMNARTDKTGTFVIKIVDNQNATWQGSVSWVEGQREQYFRSALELLKLIDGALVRNEEIEGGRHEK